MRLLAIGECMAEMAPTDRPGEYRLGFAGDTFNTAWYVARCSADMAVSYLTVVGDDAISLKMRAFMRDSGIDDRFVQVSPERTIGLYLISLEDGERSFAYWRRQSAAKTLADDADVLDAAMAASDCIYFSGITLAVLMPQTRATLLNIIEQARAMGKTVVFDPNLRPKLWAGAAEMTTAIMQGARGSDIVLPSFEDEATWFSDETPMDTALRYQAAGATTVVVKNGEGPVYYVDGKTSGEVPVTPVATVVDSTAAGDSFNAGILARRAVGDPVAAGIAYACALSRAVVLSRGALAPIDPCDLAGGAG